MKIGLIGSAFRRDDPLGIAMELQIVLERDVQARVYLPRVTRFPHNPLDLMIQEIGYLCAGIDAIEDGCDAIVLNTVGDYALAALRSATRRPVVGAGETGMIVAASLGRPFAIVTVWPRSTDFLYASVLRQAGLGESCCEVRYVGSETELSELGTEHDYIAQMQRGERSILDRIVAECREAVAGGARSVLFGCTCMSGVADAVSRAIDVPVVNPMTVAVTHAAMLARLGLAQSQESFRPASPDAVVPLRAMLEAAARIGGDASNACEVCEVMRRGDVEAGVRCGVGAGA